ncbi:MULTISPECIES: DMT family transporter [Halostella]|uniref:DMT family transporter n=1 Tax=Halostella TaxID=1843185 RepID=UPI00108098F9|nr:MULTISPECIES: DMT family transporter [Halostella]
MTRYRTVAGFVLLGTVWGTSFPAAKAGLAVLPPALLAAFRFDAVAVLVLGYAALSDARWRPGGRDWLAIVAAGVCIVAVHHALLFAGQQYVTSAVAAVVVSSIPVLTAGASRVAFPTDRLDPATVTGLFLGLAGVAVVARPSPNDVDASAFGVALVFGSALAWAVGAVAVERVRTDLSAPALQGWAMVVGAPLLHAASVALGEPQTVAWSSRALVAMAYLVVVAGGAGYLLYFSLLDRLGSLEINLVNYLVPVFAALAGWLALGEPLSLATVVGFGVVFAGFGLVKRKALRDVLRARTTAS